jgi:hypothetical protein
MAELTTEQASKMVKDIARNSYEVGYERGFKEAKRRARNLMLAVLAWVIFCAVAFLMVAGCAPVASVGVGYEINGNTVGRQPSAHLFLGGETTRDGPLSGSCGWYHLSHYLEGSPFNWNDETWSDQLRCAVRYSWRDR